MSEPFLILERTQRDTIINVTSSSCKCPFFLSEFSQQIFRKTRKYRISWKSVQW